MKIEKPEEELSNQLKMPQNQMLDIIKHSDALKLSETTTTTKALVAQFVLRAKYSVVGSATKASKWLQ